MTVNQFIGFRKFVEEQGGVWPATVAAFRLKISPQALTGAGDRGTVQFFSIGRNRWYGCKSIEDYWWTFSTKNKESFQVRRRRKKP